MAKVYFACSMRGGFSNVSQEDLRKIPDIIKSLGHTLMTEHQVSSSFKKEESSFTSAEIYKRDYAWVKDCDFLVAEISNPSLGVGAEISDALKLNKPVICFYKKDLEENISAYIRGISDLNFKCYSYENLEDIKSRIKSSNLY